MNSRSVLNSLRRRWWIIVLFTILGATAGAIPEPEQVDEQEEREFTATHTLLQNEVDTNQATTPSVSPSQVTLFVTTGEVPLRAAEALDFEGSPANLASQVIANYDFTSGALTITSTQGDGAYAEDVANTFADELSSYLVERQDVTYQERLAASIDRLTELETELTEISREVARTPDDPVLSSQQNAISRQYSVAFEQSSALEAFPPVLSFTTLQRAQAVEIIDSGLAAPRSRQTRAILGGVVGAAIGVAIALLLGVLDRRIRSRAQAEEALDLRARVLIPKVKDGDRDQLVVTTDRHDPLSDSYRTVRQMVSFVQGPAEARSRAAVTLVVSPSPGDGKTSLAVNLAAASAEAGQRTVLVNSDFRRPRVGKVFGSAVEPSLPFEFEDLQSLSGRTLLSRTGVERLRLLDLSSLHAPAGELARATAQKLDELVDSADHVVIDSSPIGATAEVLDLVPKADVILMVVRVGNGTITQAQRSIAILRDLTEVPILLVLGGLKLDKAEYYEYTDRQGDDDSGRRRFRRRSRRRATPEIDAPDDPTDEQERLFEYEPAE